MDKYLRITDTSNNGAAVDLSSGGIVPTAAVYGGSGSATVTKENAANGILKISYAPAPGVGALVVVDSNVTTLGAGDRYREVAFEVKPGSTIW